MTNLATNLAVAAALHPSRSAVRLDDRALTYAQLDDLASRAVGFLQDLGVEPGDRIGLMLPNVASFPILYYGILRLGAVAVPLNPSLKAREIEHCVADSGLLVLLVHTSVEAEELAVIQPEHVVVVVDDESVVDRLVMQSTPVPAVYEARGSDTAVILYTSGTTGKPKGAELTHDNLLLNAEVVAEMLGLTHSDVVMGCLPLFHAFGQTSAMNAAFVARATLTLATRFDAAGVLDVLDRDGVTVFEGVPTMYNALLVHAGDRDITRRLRLCVSGGSALPGEVHRQFEAVFGSVILEGYGLSETSPSATFNLPGDAKVGSIGKPVPGVELRLATPDGTVAGDGEVGEIAIRGHNVMKGYWRRPKETAEAIRDGWFYTGDLARRDSEGHYYIVDRKKDVIIRGGMNVYPREVEDVLYEHPAILEVAVVGVPDATLGEEIGAAVVLSPGMATSADDISEFVKARVARYKYPRIVWFLDSLPKGATGKILKRAVPLPEGASRS